MFVIVTVMRTKMMIRADILRRTPWKTNLLHRQSPLHLPVTVTHTPYHPLPPFSSPNYYQRIPQNRRPSIKKFSCVPMIFDDCFVVD